MIRVLGVREYFGYYFISLNSEMKKLWGIIKSVKNFSSIKNFSSVIATFDFPTLTEMLILTKIQRYYWSLAHYLLLDLFMLNIG